MCSLSLDYGKVDASMIYSLLVISEFIMMRKHKKSMRDNDPPLSPVDQCDMIIYRFLTGNLHMESQTIL